MAEFLNKEKLLEWIPRLIETAERELIIISPYIQVSEKILTFLKDAQNRGVETTLVYKEGELSENERRRFFEIANLNLLFHPNLHSKCMYNEKYLLLTSMNLYEYSQKHNREMGVVFRRTDEDAEGFGNWNTDRDEESIFEDAIEEIRSIINSAEFEKESDETRTDRFDMNIIKSKKDLAEERAARYNVFLKNKKFVAVEESGEWVCRCIHFTDGVDITMEERRISIQLNFEAARVREIYSSLNTENYNGSKEAYRTVGCFKFYWTQPHTPPRLYPDFDHPLFANEPENAVYLKGFFEGIYEFFALLKAEIRRTKR